MRVLLVHVGVSSSGAPRRREERLDVHPLTIGRAPDNHLVLTGLNVSLHHATISRGQAAPMLQATDSAELRLNGQLGGEGRLRPGDVIRIGRWELRVLPPGRTENLKLEVEEIEHSGNEFDGLRARTEMGVGRGIVNARSLSLLALALVLAAFLAAPLGFGWFMPSWSSGAIARKHAFIANECERCHASAFARVANDACTACHEDVAHHVRAEARADHDFRCPDCHPDHNGDTLTLSIYQRCEGCHARIREIYADVELPDVSDFGVDHPRFRYRIVTGPSERRRLAAGPDLREESGIRFDHFRHVGQLTTQPEGGHGRLQCGRCHEPDASGRMRPISFETHCRDCHQLTFDAALPDVQAVHGPLVGIRAQLRALYSERVLSGRVSDPTAPETVRFMRPGRTLSQRESDVVSVWVREQVERAEKHLMEEPGECVTCHELVGPAGADAMPEIAAVEISSSWFPAARFTHTTHAQSACRTCHAGAAVYDPEDMPDSPRPEWSLPESVPYGLATAGDPEVAPSRSSKDVLIPDLEQCQSCHRGPSSAPPAIASACVMCHGFHRPENGPMREAPAAAGITLLRDGVVVRLGSVAGLRETRPSRHATDAASHEWQVLAQRPIW